jgi:hypothetical protein
MREVCGTVSGAALVLGIVCGYSDPGDKEYIYAPVFLGHAKEIMGEEAFNSFLREVYQTYAMKIVHSGEILKILRKYDNSSKMNELIAFYFDSSQ